MSSRVDTELEVSLRGRPRPRVSGDAATWAADRLSAPCTSERSLEHQLPAWVPPVQVVPGDRETAPPPVDGGIATPAAPVVDMVLQICPVVADQRLQEHHEPVRHRTRASSGELVRPPD